MSSMLPLPRMPPVLNGRADLLERFMLDCMVGMFDVAHQRLEAVAEVHRQPIAEHAGMTVELITLPPGEVFSETCPADCIDLDVLVAIERTVGTTEVPAGAFIGEHSIRAAKGLRFERRADARGAMWLCFRGVA